MIKKYEEREKFIGRHRNPDPSTPLGRRVYKYKEWMEEYARKQVAIGDMFTFPDPSPLPNVDVSTPKEEIKLIEMKNVTFKYPTAETFVFKKETNCVITAGTRMGIMGPNGAGKSTFLKLLTGKLKPTTGETKVAEGFKLAYFGQHSAEELDLQMTPFEWMCFKYPKVKQQGKLKHHLKKAGMENEMSDTRMIGFSGGQKARVIFAQLTYECPHLLIMDEPTNFLDLESVDSLITACNKYKGAMLLVTHSRHMLHSCGNIYLSITPGKFQFFESISDCERATYRFIKDVEEGTKVKITSVQGGSSELVDEEEEDFSQEAIIRRRKKQLELMKQKELDKKDKNEIVKKEIKVDNSINIDDLKVGDLCFGFWYEDKKFYKAKLRQISKKNNTVCVQFVDYGNSIVLKLEQILQYDENLDLNKIPVETRKNCYYLHLESIKEKKKDLLKKKKLKKERMLRRKLMTTNKNKLKD